LHGNAANHPARGDQMSRHKLPSRLHDGDHLFQ